MLCNSLVHVTFRLSLDPSAELYEMESSQELNPLRLIFPRSLPTYGCRIIKEASVR